MSAREKLYAALMKGGPHSPDRSEGASALLDAYAHELAERQRQHLRDEGYILDCICDGCSVCLTKEFIDLIDPEGNTNG